MSTQKFSVLLVILLVSVTQIFGARILGYVVAPSYSHQVVFQSLWKELSLRGHQVTVLTSHPVKDASLKNLTEIDISSAFDAEKEASPNEIAELNAFDMIGLINQVGYDILDAQLQHPEVKKIIQDETAHFDVVLVETLFAGAAAFAERFKCPLIQIFSLDAPFVNHYSIGNPAHPVLNPDFMLPFSANLSFLERLTSTAYVVLSMVNHQYNTIPIYNSLVKKHFGDGLPSIEETLSKTSLMFVNTDLAFHPLRPLTPNVIQIGGGTHLGKPKPLPKHLQTILDGAKNGVIYFSLGSNLKSSQLPEDTQKLFMETFAELPYTFLWKFEKEDLPGKPKNVFISRWFPQQDVFRHPNVKGFITQGGLQSMDEAAHNHIPIVGIPFLGDQKSNVRRIVSMGIGVDLDRKALSKSSLKNAILEIVTNPKYRNRVRQLAELAKDEPMTGLERGVWWTEYVIRHKGAAHLRSPALDLPMYQYFLLDVIAFCLAFILIATYVFVKTVKLLLKFARYCFGKSKVKVE